MFVKVKDLTPKTEYVRISGFDKGLVQMEKNGFVYLIINKSKNLKWEQWEQAVCLSTGTIENRIEIEEEYERHGLGFKELRGTVELRQVPEKYTVIESVLGESSLSEEEIDSIMGKIAGKDIL